MVNVMTDEPDPVDSRFFRGFALAAVLSLAMWGTAGIGLASAHPHFASHAYHKVRPVLHQARLCAAAALGWA